MLKQLCPDAETKFYHNYSDERFLSIKIGMTEQKVIEMPGEPLNRWNPIHADSIALTYSEPEKSGDYSLRQIYLSNGKVNKMVGFFFVD